MFVPVKEEAVGAAKENIYEILYDKILICKKDIACKEGTFKKNAVVYPAIVNYQVTMLYDLRDWAGDGESIKRCSFARPLEKITIDNYFEYFEINEKASALYQDMTLQQAFIQGMSDGYKENANSCFGFGLIMLALASVVCWLSETGRVNGASVYIVMFILIGLSIMSFISMISINFVKTRKTGILIANLDNTKEKLLLSIINEEQYSGVCDNIVNAKKDLLRRLQEDICPDKKKDKKSTTRH